MLKYLVKKKIESFLNSRFQNNGKKATVNDDTFFIFTTDPQKYSQINKVEKIYCFNNKNCPFFMKRLVKNLDGYINLHYMFHNILFHMSYPKSESIQNDSTIRSCTGSVLMDMDASDTITIQWYQSNGTAQADISAQSSLSIFLAC